MISKVIILLVILTRTLSQLCDKEQAIDISKGTHLPHKVIYHESIKYERDEYFLDENGREMGCICLKKQCISKCCPFGLGYSMKDKTCVSDVDDFDPPVWDKYRLLEQKANDTFHFIFGKRNCTLPELRIVIGRATTGYHVQTVREY
ncbi:G protein-coupled receptor [Operophtera brumata]|uniref:G protein-coupled receptor n=1 Tax=Operophtera brumata TaxID=104452 RepID=A0A0L7KLC6_OPEBR|nr:G protein-coupled receptor [Operophtera brumata]